MADGSLRDHLLAADALPFEDVEVRGAFVRVKGLSTRGRDQFEAMITGEDGTVELVNIRAKLIACTSHDPKTDGLVFTDEDVEALGETAAQDMEPLFSAAMRLSGFTEEDLDELKGN